MSFNDYIKSFLDPFDTTIPQPKIYDGANKMSSGLRLRTTGNFTLDAAGLDNYLVLFPCFSAPVSFRAIGDDDYATSSVFPNHMNDDTSRDQIKSIRLVSSALKLSLMNNGDDNEGYWEAVRIPIENMELADKTSPLGEDGVVHLVSTRTFTDLAVYPTFQTGLLRELDRFLFKLNSTNADHPFVMPGHDDSASTTTFNTRRRYYDPNFDIVVIRLVGRINATTPSVIRYTAISNQEIVYRQDTPMARLATQNSLLGSMPQVLDKTQFNLPAVQTS